MGAAGGDRYSSIQIVAKNLCFEIDLPSYAHPIVFVCFIYLIFFFFVTDSEYCLTNKTHIIVCLLRFSLKQTIAYAI